MTDDEASLCAGLACDLNSHFERLVLSYQHRLYLFALRYTGAPGDAEEVVQDAFVRAYRALETYPSARIQSLALRPWLFRIVLNLARNRARRRQPHHESLADSNGHMPYEPLADGREQPYARVEQAERARHMGRLVAALPPRYRVTVILRYINELEYAEIAALLGQPLGTVKSNVHRGLRLLRAAWEDAADVEKEGVAP